MSQYNALRGRMRQELTDLERVVSRAVELAQKAQQTGDDGYWDGVALNLHSFYTGAERIFEEIAKEIDRAMPSGSDWHRTLLVQMSAEIPSVRPPVISQETRHCLDEYRSFRHVVRNLYTFNLRPSRLQALAADVSACYTSLNQDLSALSEFLHSLDAGDF
jgi:hypothetical protein